MDYGWTNQSFATIGHFSLVLANPCLEAKYEQCQDNDCVEDFSNCLRLLQYFYQDDICRLAGLS